MAEKQTAGRNELGTFAPKFAELNDDVLFGDIWSRENQLSLRCRTRLLSGMGQKSHRDAVRRCCKLPLIESSRW